VTELRGCPGARFVARVTLVIVVIGRYVINCFGGGSHAISGNVTADTLARRALQHVVDVT
jgi:hypothetical protein